MADPTQHSPGLALPRLSSQPLTFLNQVSLGLQLRVVHVVLRLVLHGVVPEEILQRHSQGARSGMKKEACQGTSTWGREVTADRARWAKFFFLLCLGLISTQPQGI